MSVGESIKRVDARQKVTGEAKYTDEYMHKGAYIAKVLHSIIANGVVKRMDISKAMQLDGVIKIVTCFDVPNFLYATAGHPWSIEPDHQDVADRKLLNTRVRYYGDDIAVVIAKDELIATKALHLIDVEYEQYDPIITPQQAMQSYPIHDNVANNILGDTAIECGKYDEAISASGLKNFSGNYQTQMVQHCHIELPISYAYMENDRIVVVSGTQIPHIVRRVTAQALGLEWGKVRVIKPYLGGGFGNRQDVLYEPLNAYLTTLVGGRCVKLELSREETFVNTRVRHAMEFDMSAHLDKNGKFVARTMDIIVNQGGYASHGHSVSLNAFAAGRQLYTQDAFKATVKTVYTNLPVAGAMRGYGVPQCNFALESFIDDIAKKLEMDPIEFRKINMMKKGYCDPTDGVVANSYGLDECIEKGKMHIKWEEKRQKYQNQTGNIRRGVGVAIFNYKAGIYPISLEVAGARAVMNQDGSVQLQMGATEIGQGADTVFSQIFATTLGIPVQDVHIMTTQDTDITPMDTAAYASRQTYVSGMAAKKAALMLKDKVLHCAAAYKNEKVENLNIVGRDIIETNTGRRIVSLCELATEAFYSRTDARGLFAEVYHQCKSNAYSTGVCFAEVEVDMAIQKIKVIKLVNVHDSGKLINPELAKAQVHGGQSMGLGYAMGETMLFKPENGKPLNNNFLDYKITTSMDTPELVVDFVQNYEKTAPYGNKSLGEPPTVPVAAAIRNAVLHATGVALNKIPLLPQYLYEEGIR